MSENGFGGTGGRAIAAVMALNSTAATAVKDNLNLELLEWAPSLPANLAAVAKYAAEAKLASGEKYYGATRSAKAGRWFASRTYTEKGKQFTATDTVSFENDGKKYARDIEISGDVEQIFDGKYFLDVKFFFGRPKNMFGHPKILLDVQKNFWTSKKMF